MRLFRKCPKCGWHCGRDKKTREYLVVCPKCSISLKKQSWYIDYYVFGRRKREKVGPDRRLAELVLKKRKIEIVEDKFLDIRRDRVTTFEEIAQDFLDYSRNNKRSYGRDEIIVRNLSEFFSGKRLNEITPILIEQYKGKRLNQDKKKPATVNRELAGLKCMFNWAIKNGKATQNPVKQVKLFKEDNTRIRYLSKEEIKKLLECSKNYHPNILPILVTALCTGMRKGEILNLKWEDVNFEQGIILLKNTKSGKMREIPMSSFLQETLKKCFDRSDGVYVFCNEERKPYKSIDTIFQRVLKRTGITDFCFHDLRHTAASYLIMLGVDLATVKDILGHQKIEMTLRYAHLSPVHKRSAMELLGTKMDTIWTPESNEETPAEEGLSESLIIPTVFEEERSPRGRGRRFAKPIYR